MAIPTYTEKDIAYVVEGLIDLLEDEDKKYIRKSLQRLERIREPDLIDLLEDEDKKYIRKSLQRLERIREPEDIVKYAIMESWDLSTFDSFIRELQPGKNFKNGLAIELLGWAHYWEEKWDT